VSDKIFDERNRAKYKKVAYTDSLRAAIRENFTTNESALIKGGI